MANIIAAIKDFFAKVWAAIKGIFNKEEEPDSPDTPAGPNDIVCYYGCPNSKETSRLQLEKKLWE